MQETKAECWAKLIAEQEATGESVRAFCRRLEVGEKAFYWWRRRLRNQLDVRFALLETRPTVDASTELGLELIFVSGEQTSLENRHAPSPSIPRSVRHANSDRAQA